MNHKWNDNKCITCGLIRSEIPIQNSNGDNEILKYQYLIDSKNDFWVTKRPGCIKKGRSQNLFIPEKNIKIVDKIDFKKQYSELLKSPKWQRKRLEIMQRDNWMCQSCFDDQHELHVHHVIYSENIPWHEPNENLITLCSTCHDAWHFISSCIEFDWETFYRITSLYSKFLPQFRIFNDALTLKNSSNG